jgi:hypothetical protein
MNTDVAYLTIQIFVVMGPGSRSLRLPSRDDGF